MKSLMASYHVCNMVIKKKITNGLQNETSLLKAGVIKTKCDTYDIEVHQNYVEKLLPSDKSLLENGALSKLNVILVKLKLNKSLSKAFRMKQKQKQFG